MTHYFYFQSDYEKSSWIQQITHNVALINGTYNKEEKAKKQNDILTNIIKYKLKLAKKEGEVLLHTEGMFSSWGEHYLVLDDMTFTVHKGSSKGGKVLYKFDRLGGCSVGTGETAPSGMSPSSSFDFTTKFGDVLHFWTNADSEKASWMSVMSNNIMFDDGGFHDRPKVSAVALSPEAARELLGTKGIKDIKALGATHGVDFTGCLSKEDIIEKAVLSEALRKDLV